jgi:hypothetical protein
MFHLSSFLFNSAVCASELNGKKEPVFVDLFMELRNRFLAWWAGTTTLFVVPARQRPNLKTFMVVGTPFLGTDSSGGISSAVEVIPGIKIP